MVLTGAPITRQQILRSPRLACASAGSMAPVPSLRVLCFGDSLTSGFSNLGASSHPYSQQLAARLKEAFPDLEKIHVVPNGVPGDRVMNAGFQARLEKAGTSFERIRRIPAWVIVVSY